MCCCIPLRTLSYFGAILHMGIGIYFYYLCGAVVYGLYTASDADDSVISGSRRNMAIMYMAYYAVFLPPGIFIFWGVQKKLRRFLIWSPLAFFLIQVYSIGLQSTYGYRPQSVPDAIKHHHSNEALKKLRIDFWMSVFIQVTATLSYLFLLFFYYREIGPESAPVQSRYAQYPYIAQTVAALQAHHEQQQQQAAALALHRPQQSQPPPTTPAPPPPQQNQAPQLPPLPPHLSHLAIGSNAVAYHPGGIGGGPSGAGSSSMPVAISPAASGPITVLNTPLPRTSSSTTVPQQGMPVPQISLATLASLSYEQQQQILKFHQNQLMLQQQHHHQPMQSMSQPLPQPLTQQQLQQILPHSSQIEQELQQQILQQFPAYAAAILGANQPGKSPKY